MSKWLGRSHAGKLLKLAHRGKEALKDRMQTHGIDCGYRPGYVFVSLTPAHDAVLADMCENFIADLGIAGARWMTGPDLSDYVRSPLYRGGLYDPTAGSLDAVRLLAGLADASAAGGALLFERAAVRRIRRLGRRHLAVETQDGTVTAGQVVLACSPGEGVFGSMPPGLVQLSTTTVVLTEPLVRAEIDQILPTWCSGSDWRYEADYWAVTGDDRLLFGGTPEAGEDAQSSLIQRLGEVFPTMADAGVARSWQGQVAKTRTLLPQIGRIDEDIWVGRGYNGVGLVLAYLAGWLIAEGIGGRCSEIEVFERIPQRVRRDESCNE